MSSARQLRRAPSACDGLFQRSGRALRCNLFQNAIAKRIVEAHDGIIDAVRAIGSGTTVRVASS